MKLDHPKYLVELGENRDYSVKGAHLLNSLE